MSNIWDREYQDHKGRTKYGLTANLTIWDDTDAEEIERYLGKGGIIDLKDEGRWKVAKIKAGKGAENGFVVLKRL